MEDFEKIWAIFPRKVAKYPAQQEWVRMTAGEQFAAFHALPVHVRFWKAAGENVQFIPHLRTWLHQKRWTDELDVLTVVNNDWMRSQAGIEAKARELGMWPPKAGEDWHSLKTRILARAA